MLYTLHMEHPRMPISHKNSQHLIKSPSCVVIGWLCFLQEVSGVEETGFYLEINMFTRSWAAIVSVFGPKTDYCADTTKICKFKEIVHPHVAPNP